MKKKIPLLLILLLPFYSISQVKEFSFDNIVDSLKVISNDVIVYKQYYSSTRPTETKIYIAYKKDDGYRMISLILFENKIKRYDQLINKGIFLIYENNFTAITKLLLSSANNLDSIERKPDGTIVIEKIGSSHGTGYYFRIINKKMGIDVEKKYCCGLVENHFFIEELYPIWLLMSAFEMENKIGVTSLKSSRKKCRTIFPSNRTKKTNN